MRKLLMSGLLLLVSCAWVMAQSGSGGSAGGVTGGGGNGAGGMRGSNAATGANSSDTSGNQTSIRGCLSESNGTYTVTDDQGATYTLEGKNSDLSKYVGHKIDARGTPANAQPSDIKAGDVTKSPRTTEQTTVAGSPSGQVFNVTHVRKMSGSCPNPSSK